jgi:hypothetical protein
MRPKGVPHDVSDGDGTICGEAPVWCEEVRWVANKGHVWVSRFDVKWSEIATGLEQE